MRRAVLAVWLLGLAGAMPASAQVAEVPPAVGPAMFPDGQAAPEAPAPTGDGVAQAEPLPWETVWGLAGFHVFAAGPKEAPNGQKYHPYHTLDLDFNIWIWRRQGLYLFADSRFWNEKPEYGVTNVNDTALGFSKRQFDLVLGPAWNYAGSWEARCFGYTFNNLNRGLSSITPAGINDGFGMENRYYLTEEYANLGHAGFDVARADFLSIGYYASKSMVGNDGRKFKPGPMLRAYLTCDLGSWPAYVFGDVTYLGKQPFGAKLLLYDVGLAVRPFSAWERFSAWKNFEGRLGVENTADLEVGNVQNLWYASVRFIF
jgi:hypothetical protein